MAQLSTHSKTSFLIRDASFKDADAVANLLEQLGYPCDASEAKMRIEMVASEGDQFLRLAEMDGLICGLIGLHYMYYLPIGRVTCRITTLVVLEGMRKSGVGSALLKHAESEARRAGAARIELTTAETREAAHRFYRKSGYEQNSLRFLKRLGDA